MTHRPKPDRRLARVAVIGLALAALLTLMACSALQTPEEGATATESIGPNGPIGWSEAQARIGDEVTAEGLVSSVHTSGNEVSLDLGADAPDPSRLVVVIPAASRDAFPADAASAYQDKLVLVPARVEDRDGVATIVVTKPAELKIE